MSDSREPRSGLGTFSTLSIGIGGMVGGGIFATTGLAVQVTRGAVPIAFVASGLVALLTSYAYLKLTLRFPGEGGTVEFLNRGFGTGIPTGAANLLLCFSYVVLVAIYAYALGSYAATFFPESEHDFWRRVFQSGALVALAVLNVLDSRLVIRSENVLNLIKMGVLVGFVVAGLLTPLTWERLAPANFVRPVAIVSGAMLVFFNYEGFELIANASREVRDPERSLPVAYLGGVLLAMALYVAIAVVVAGHMSFGAISLHGDHALSAAADELMGPAGRVLITIAAVLACGSAINATLYSSGRLTYIVARSGELPGALEREVRGQPLEGTIVFTVLSLLLANAVPLDAIATMGSAGFLFIFMSVNLASARLARETGASLALSLLGAGLCAASLVLLCVEVDENPATRSHLWIVVGMALASVGLEWLYRRSTRRTIAPIRGADDR